MATIYICKKCGIRIPRAQERQSHLHWHNVRDKDLAAHFTEQEEVEDETPPARAAGAATAPAARGKLYAVVVAVGVAAALAVILMVSAG